MYFIGFACLISNSIILYVTFLWAYLFNDFKLSIDINSIGEAHIEFFLIPITIIIGLYSIRGLIKYLPKKSSASFK